MVMTAGVSFMKSGEALIEGNTQGDGGGVRRTDGAAEAAGDREADVGGAGLNVIGKVFEDNLDVFVDPLRNLAIVLFRGRKIPSSKIGWAFAAVETEDTRNMAEVGPQ
jgi:hypothetical protein